MNTIESEKPIEQVELDTCIFCEEPFTDTKQVTLECNHLCHLRCLLVNTAATHQVDMLLECPHCNELIINDDIQRDIYAKADVLVGTIDIRARNENKINSLMETSEPFRKFVKEYKIKESARKVKERLFKKKINEIYKTYREKIKDILTILKGIHKTTIDTICQTDEYKNFMKASSSFRALSTKYSKKYEVCPQTIYRRLYGRRAYYRFHRYNILNYMIRSKFRIYIR